MKIPGKSYFCKSCLWRPIVFLLVFLNFIFHASYLEGDTRPVILALGDSLTAGYGVPEDENYPRRLQVLLKENGYAYQVINAGVSGDTTAGGLRRLPWLLNQKPKIVILALGANDGLRGLPATEMYANLNQIIKICKQHNAHILLAGMKIPPNYGEDYSREFEAVFARLTKEYKLPFIPFLLEGVAAKRELTQPDGLHPLGAGYKVVADRIWKALLPML